MGSLSPIFSISTMGLAASRRPTGWVCHSWAVRTTPTAPASSRMASSSASPSHCMIAASTARCEGWHFSTLNIASRSLG